MYVSELKDLFLAYTGETDETFLSAAQRRIFFERAYAEYVEFISRLDPWIKTISVDIPLANVVSYDFDVNANPVRIMGNRAPNAPPGPTHLSGPRLDKLIQVCIVDTSTTPNRIIEIMRGTSRLDNVSPVAVQSFQAGFDWTEANYIFINKELLFNFTVNQTIRIYYIPVNDSVNGIDWANDTGGAPLEFVDDLSNFHDIIAMLAYKQYQIMDNEVNEALEGQLARRLQDFSAFLLQGRDRDGSSRVQAAY